MHSLCPMRVLRIYMSRSRTVRQSDQLFVSWAARMVGTTITKQRLSHWIVEAIQWAYSSKGMQPPDALRAHSTRGVVASWALLKGVSIQDLCAATSWSSPLTLLGFTVWTRRPHQWLVRSLVEPRARFKRKPGRVFLGL